MSDKLREAAMRLVEHKGPWETGQLMQRIHDVLLAVEPFIEFEEPDVSAVALRSEVVSLTSELVGALYRLKGDKADG